MKIPSGISYASVLANRYRYRKQGLARTQRFHIVVGVPVLSDGVQSVKIRVAVLHFHPVQVHVHAPIDTEVDMSIFLFL
jgi:hypothetical protein